MRSNQTGPKSNKNMVSMPSAKPTQSCYQQKVRTKILLHHIFNQVGSPKKKKNTQLMTYKVHHTDISNNDYMGAFN